MGEILDRAKKELRSFVPEVQRGLKEHMDMRMDDAVFEERNYNIQLAAMAMLDGGLKEEIAINMLQKYWDLRRSEVEPIITDAKRELRKK